MEKVKHFEISVSNYYKDPRYKLLYNIKTCSINYYKGLEYKERLNDIYLKKVNEIRIKSKCDWYESGGKIY